MSKQKYNMSPAEHYQTAERILGDRTYSTSMQRERQLAEAQVHATLSLAPQSHEYGAYLADGLSGNRIYYRRGEGSEKS